MSDKKSYMNKDNILQEGYIKNFMDYWKFLKKQGKNLSKKEKKMLANPKLRKAFQKFMKDADRVEKLFKTHQAKLKR